MLEQFDKIYCLNLEDRTDRWEICEENFKKYNIDGSRFLGERVVKGVYENESSKRLGQIGCALSFCKIIDDAIDKGYNSVVFFEDDFDFINEPQVTWLTIDKAYSELPEDWDMFYFGANVVDHFVNEPLEPYSNNLFKLKSAYALHSVALSRKGLLRIKEYFKDSAYTSWGIELISKFEAIDVFFAKVFQIENKCFITSDILCLQRPDFSSIERTFFNYSDLMIQRFNQFKPQ